MHMENAIRKSVQKLDRVHTLPVQVAGVEEEAELFPAVQCIERHLSTVKIEGHLARMNFQGEAHARFAANIEDGVPMVGEDAEGFRYFVRGERGPAADG